MSRPNAPAQTSEIRPISAAKPLRRLAAAALDLTTVAAWAAFAAGVGLLLRERDAWPQTPGGADLLAFLTLVLPVTLTFAAQEAGPHRATFGKRWMRLWLAPTEGGRLGFRRSLARNGLKLLPWQMAHTGVFYLAAGSTDPLYFTLAIGGQLLAVANVVVMATLSDHRAIHDRLTGTVVLAPGPRPDGNTATG